MSARADRTADPTARRCPDGLLTPADQGQPTDHGKARVCWILETAPATQVSAPTEPASAKAAH